MRNFDMNIPEEIGIYTFGLTFTKWDDASEKLLICVNVRKLSRKYSPVLPECGPSNLSLDPA